MAFVLRWECTSVISVNASVLLMCPAQSATMQVYGPRQKTVWLAASAQHFCFCSFCSWNKRNAKLVVPGGLAPTRWFTLV